MTTLEMRAAITSVYDTVTWRAKVSRMLDGQVIAIYYRFLKSGVFEKKQNKRAIRSEHEVQLMFDI